MVNKADWEFLRIWQHDVSPVREEVENLWRTYAMLPEEEIQKRIHELILVVKYKGQIIGLSTAYIQPVKLLNNHDFAFYRNFIVSQFRMAGLDFAITKESVATLEAAYPQTENQRVKGVITVVENNDLKKSPTVKKAVWVNVPFVFIGNTSAGHPIRVYYFKNARI